MIFVKEQAILKIIKIGVYAVLFAACGHPVVSFPVCHFARFFIADIRGDYRRAVCRACAQKPRISPQKRQCFSRAVFLFLILLLSTFFGLDPYRSFFGNYERMWGSFRSRISFCFSWCLLAYSRQKEEWTKLIKTSLAVGALSVAFGIVQFVGSLIMSGSAPRISSTIGNPAFFASYLFFVCFFAFLFTCATQRRGALNIRVVFVRRAFACRGVCNVGDRNARCGGGACIGIFAGAVLCVMFSKQRALKIVALSFVVLSLLGGVLLVSYGSLFEKPQRITQEQFYDIERFDAPAVSGEERVVSFAHCKHFAV